MKPILINNRTYRYADRLEELTLGAWQALMTYHATQATAGEKQERLGLGEYLLKNAVRIEERILLKTDPEDRVRFLDQWSETIARQSAASFGRPDDDTLREAAQATAKKAKIACPSDGASRGRTRKPLSGICAQAICDATDLYLEDYAGHAHTIAAILCHPKNRVYDETLIANRADGLKRMSMKIIPGLFGELNAAHRLLRGWFPSCYQNREQERLEPEKQSPAPLRWNDMLLWLADYRPSEIKPAERLPCYEFMRILDSKLRNPHSRPTPQNPLAPCLEADYFP